jgi:hypothetical protein
MPQSVLVIQAGFKTVIGLEMIDKQAIFSATIGHVIPDTESNDSGKAEDSA